MSEHLLAPTFLFRFLSYCDRAADADLNRSEMRLSDAYNLPSFGDLEGRRRFANMRMAWHPTGLLVELTVEGKSQTPWCRDSRLEDSDGLSLWIDTRDSHNIHRATRFCHRFVILPFGGGARADQPVAALLPINRARELPKPVDPRELKTQSRKLKTGYELRAFIPGSAITGYDPTEHPKLGFTYAVVDRELGWQTYSLGPEFPIDEDPSLWGTLQLR